MRAQLEMEQEQEDSLVRQYFGADGEVAEVFVKRVVCAVGGGCNVAMDMYRCYVACAGL